MGLISQILILINLIFAMKMQVIVFVCVCGRIQCTERSHGKKGGGNRKGSKIIEKGDRGANVAGMVA